MIAFHLRLTQKVAGAAIGAVLAGLVLNDSQAQALSVNVNVGGQDYEVTTFTGLLNDNVSKFATPANGGVMPWWGSSIDATAFASAVGTSSLGLPNYTFGILNSGPFFAWVYPSFAGPNSFTATYIHGDSNTIFNITTGATAASRTWAQATLIPAAPTAGSANVPGPLPALGLAVAFGFSRQLRKRIKASASNPPSTSEA